MAEIDWREGALKSELFEVFHFCVKTLRNIEQYELERSKKAVVILLKWACYSQNIASIELGRKKIVEIPKKWLYDHLLEVVKSDFDYGDDWNYRRLLELVSEVLPERLDDFIRLNVGTTNTDLIEVMDDFRS